MPSPTRKLQSVWLLTSRRGEDQAHTCVAGTFTAIYQLALFELRIAEPNLTSRQALDRWRKTGPVWLWDRSRFEYEEEALWSPAGSAALITKVPVRKV